VVEELTQADRKDEIAKDRVVETGEKQRSGMLVGEGKQETPDDAEDYGKPIAKNNVHEPESKSTSGNHQQAPAKERLVTVKEEGAVDQFLGINGNERVEEHDQGPEAGSALQEEEQELGGAKMRTASPKKARKTASRTSSGRSWQRMLFHEAR
jgi:hypothetical protein